VRDGARHADRAVHCLGTRGWTHRQVDVHERGHTIRAELSFNEAGELTNFRSDDRYQTSPDGKSMRKVRWSTPLGTYRSFGQIRLASRGEARWLEADEEYAYIELAIDDVQYNVHAR
jgi:Family of unknown function (DUF6544)